MSFNRNSQAAGSARTRQFPRKKPTIYIGPYVNPESPHTLHFCLRAAIGVDTAGKIAFIHQIKTLADVTQLLSRIGHLNPDAKREWDRAEQVIVKQGSNSFFFPGFVDTHIHAPQYQNSGIFGKSTLLDWLKRYTFPVESSFADIDRARQTYSRVVDRTLSHGTTTASYFATIHPEATNLLADICLQKGQRALIGRVCMDNSMVDYYKDKDADTALEQTMACINHIQKIDPDRTLLTPIITPRFAPACSAECLGLLGQLYRKTGLPIQTHISENRAEVELVKSLFPECKNYASVYDRAGLLTKSTILAHAIHLTDEEIELVKERRCGISHCPISNSSLSSGIAPVREFLNKKIPVGLGTDVSGGYSPSVLAVARHAILMSNHLSLALESLQGRSKTDSDSDKDETGVSIPGGSGGLESPAEAKLSTAEALYLATRGGAEVVGMADEIGGIAVGMRWDAQLVSLRECGGVELALDEEIGPVDIFGSETFEEMVDKWVFGGDDRNTVAVWVGGHRVHETRRFDSVVINQG